MQIEFSTLDTVLKKVLSAERYILMFKIWQFITLTKIPFEMQGLEWKRQVPMRFDWQNITNGCSWAKAHRDLVSHLFTPVNV